MSQDAIAAVIEVLKEDAGVADLVGARVFGLALPRAEAAAMPGKALVVSASGGPSLTGGSYIEHDSNRIDLTAYGETRFEAARVRRAAGDALKRLRRTVADGTLIHWAQPAGGWSDGVDGDLAWPTAFQSFQIFFAENPAA